MPTLVTAPRLNRHLNHLYNVPNLLARCTKKLAQCTNLVLPERGISLCKLAEIILRSSAEQGRESRKILWIRLVAACRGKVEPTPLRAFAGGERVALGGRGPKMGRDLPTMLDL